jgi:hypothetical protein
MPVPNALDGGTLEFEMTSTLTDEIAVAAARLVVEEGMEYGPAKRRAARLLGRHATRSAALPSNENVEAEVRSHLALFCDETQPGELVALRAVALVWMERLAEFRPHLAGAVWRGTATRLNAVQLELYCDDSKATEIALLDRRITFDVASRSGPRGEPIDVLVVTQPSGELQETVTLHLSVLDHDDLRGALKPDAHGRTWRGDLVALRKLMEPA